MSKIEYHNFMKVMLVFEMAHGISVTKFIEIDIKYLVYRENDKIHGAP